MHVHNRREFRLAAAATALSVLAVACSDRSAAFLGTWELWSVDGIPLREVAADVLQLPAFEYRGIRLEAGEVWSETKIFSRTLDVFDEQREYLDVSVKQVTHVYHPASLRALGALPARQEQPTDTAQTLGTWELLGDSIRFRIGQEQVVEPLLQSLRAAAPPGTSDDELRSLVAEALADYEIPDQLVGVRQGDRLASPT